MQQQQPLATGLALVVQLCQPTDCWGALPPASAHLLMCFVGGAIGKPHQNAAGTAAAAGGYEEAANVRYQRPAPGAFAPLDPTGPPLAGCILGISFYNSKRKP